MRITHLHPTLCLLVAGVLTLGGRALAQEKAPAPPAEPQAAKAPATEPAEAPKAPPKRNPRPGDVQKVFAVRNVSAQQLAQLLSIFPATITYSNSAGTRALGISAAPAVMGAIEETLKRLDVPLPSLKNVELTGYVVEALPQAVEGASVPPELDGVVAQLKRTFSYAAYRLVDTLVARARQDSGLQAKAVGERDQGPSQAQTKPRYTLRVRRAGISSDDSGTVVRLDGLDFSASVPVRVGGSGSYTFQDVGVAADLDIREGQRVVVGKSGVGEAGNAIILVLSAKVVD